MSDSNDPKIIRIDPAGDNAQQEAQETLEKLLASFHLPPTPLPQAELELLKRVALGETGQSRSVRYLLFLLSGAKEPGGFAGNGLLELRALDAQLAEAFLKIIDWWRGPTKTDAPLYEVLDTIEGTFRK